MAHGRISRLSVHDVRFPTSLGGHGSDAMHTDPDYSAAYVVIETDAEDGLKGYGITFTLGRGTEVVGTTKVLHCTSSQATHMSVHRADLPEELLLFCTLQGSEEVILKRENDYWPSTVVKVSAVKPHDLSSSPGIHMVEGENLFLQDVL